MVPAAAPVVAAFKTNMVLATPRAGNVTVMASSFASVTTTGGSVAPNAQTTGLFLPMSECEKHQGCDDLLFGPDGCDRSHKRGCGFEMMPSPAIAKKTLKQVFKMDERSDMERLAQYLAARNWRKALVLQGPLPGDAPMLEAASQEK